MDYTYYLGVAATLYRISWRAGPALVARTIVVVFARSRGREFPDSPGLKGFSFFNHISFYRLDEDKMTLGPQE